MKQLEASCFIDDDPTLIDFLKRKPLSKAHLPVYNINEQSLARSEHRYSPVRYDRLSPERISRLSVFTGRKTSEDRRFRVRTSSTAREPQSAKSGQIDLLRLKRQMLEATERHPAMARIARERLNVLSNPMYTLAQKPRKPMQGVLKRSMVTLQPHQQQQRQQQDRQGPLKSKFLALMVDNPFKAAYGYSEFL